MFCSIVFDHRAADFVMFTLSKLSLAVLLPLHVLKNLLRFQAFKFEKIVSMRMELNGFPKSISSQLGILASILGCGIYWYTDLNFSKWPFLKTYSVHIVSIGLNFT